MENNYEKYMYYSMYYSSVPYSYYMMSKIRMENLYNNEYIQDLNNENFRIDYNNDIQNVRLESHNNSDNINNLKQDEYEKESFNDARNTTSRGTLSEEVTNQALKIGPATITSNGINLFGIDFETGDIVLIGVILFLFFEQERDYLLLIVLVLMLFDISLDSIGEMSKIKDVLKFI